MRKRLFGTAALLAASHLATAAPQPPESLPPAPLTLSEEAAPAQQPAPPELAPPPTPVPAPPGPGGASTRAQPQRQAPTAQAQSQAQTPMGTGAAGTAAPQFKDEHCGPPENSWFGGGPVLWWIKDAPLPLLARAGTGQVLGGGDVGYGAFNGFQIDGGTWLDCRHTIGVTLGGFLLEQRGTSNALFSDATGAPAITRPIVDAVTAQPIDVLAASPGAFAGGVLYEARARLAGAQAGFVKNLAYDCGLSLDMTFGFRYLDLEEELAATQVTRALDGGRLTVGGVPATAAVLTDDFRTRNQFYGGQIGTRAEYRLGPAFFNVSSSVAVGPNHETITISGATRDPNTGNVQPGGLLAVGQAISAGNTGGNIGRQITDRITVVPEAAAQVGVQVTRHVRLSAGYQFLYMNDVARPGPQVDPVINPRLVPISPTFGTLSGQAAPRITIARNDFFAHGALLRVEVNY